MAARSLTARLARLEAAGKERAERARAAEASGELRRRILDSLFPHQRAFVENGSRWKAAQCTRRAGKTWSLGAMIILTALSAPGCDMLYIGLTNDAARRALIRQVLRPLNERFGLGLEFVHQDLVVRFPNGAQLYILGLDSNQGLADRLLGGKYKLCIIDEVQSFTVDVADIIDNKIGPGLNDLDGTMVLAGTAGNLLTSYYYEVCHEKRPRWSLHKWSAEDNPAQARQHREAVARAKEEGREQDPGFRQNYLNEWAIETSAKVYAFDPAKNLYDKLPVMQPSGWKVSLGGIGGWHRILSMDTGHTDDFAWSLLSWHEHDPRLFVEFSAKKPGLDITDAANHTKELRTRLRPQKLIIDGANALAVAELRKRHGLPLVAADKHTKTKAEWIDLVNADMRRGLVLFQRTETVPLQNEMAKLIWDPRIRARTGQRVELAGIPNHCCDTLTYAHRDCYQYRSKPPDERPNPYLSDTYDDAAESRQRAAEAFVSGANLENLATPWSGQW